MQQNKANKFKGELGSILKNKEEAQSKIESVMELFTIKKQLKIFDTYKQKGHQVSTLLTMLLLLPFYGASNIFGLKRLGIGKANKDAYYTVKNDERIDWRALLFLMSKQFLKLIDSRASLKKQGITALIGDDSLMGKTGKKMENVSMVHDHVTNTFVLGFKILVLGFWDGGSFIPVDFSIHREKGTRLQKARQAVKSAVKSTKNAEEKVNKAKRSLKKKTMSVQKHQANVNARPTNTNINRLKTAVASQQKALSRLYSLEKELKLKKLHLSKTEQEKKATEKRYPQYGLSRKEKGEQYSKDREKKSNGAVRCSEANSSKTDMLITMIKRAVKNGFVPDYVLTDTWFFSQKLLVAISGLASKGIRLLSMVKMGNATYTALPNGQVYNAEALLKVYGRQAKYSRKFKSHYIKVPVTYYGIRINLFFIKMGRNGKWKLLATNDLDMGFVKAMQVYQLRWSIEVFFKESKQYLNLGDSCSSDFDGQVADATISMLQHIMLSFFKRMNHQQSFGELFKEISHEMEESTLAENLWQIFIVVLQGICELLGMDIMETIEKAINNDEVLELLKHAIFQKSTLKMAA